MRFFLTYLWHRRKFLLAFVLIFIVLSVSFLLYRLPLAAVLYPMLLCIAAGIFTAVYDCRRIYVRHTRLMQLQSLPDELASLLPAAQTITDRDYQTLLCLLEEQRTAMQTQMFRKYDDMVEYYTVWVHQIKTPIASMRLHLQGEDSPLSRQLSADLFRIEQYVQMVLVFLRLDSASTDYVLREYELDTIVRQAVKNYAGEFIGRRLKLCYEPLDTRVLTDEKWLLFVVEQVLSNALKYTPSGSITVDMAQAGVLRIRDTGMGIAPEDLPRIFEKGYTGGMGRTDKRASGIGLYLCRRICRNLGHDISASSVPGEGTSVCIDLRRAQLRVE